MAIRSLVPVGPDADHDQSAQAVLLSALGILQALPSRLKSAYVFPSATGETPLNPKNFLNRHFLPAVSKANLDDFRWHDLRHTYGSRLAMRGVDLRSLQELMGHQTVTMTTRYAHLAPGHLHAAVQRLSETRGDTLSDTAPPELETRVANRA